MRTKQPAGPARGIGRRSTMIAAGIAAALLIPLGSTAASAHGSSNSSFAHEFESASADTGGMFRWWWPSSVDANVAVQQLEAVAAAGYRGVEIAFVMDGTDYVVDPNEFEYGDANWRSAVNSVLKRANQIDMQVDLTLGGRWPAAVPGLDVSTQQASQEIAMGYAIVAAGEEFSGAAPAPAARTYADRTVQGGVVVSETKTSNATLANVIAAPCTTTCAEATPSVDLDGIEVLEPAADGTISWTAPDERTWVLIAGWQRGTAQRNDAPFGTTVSPLSAPESRVVNHLDRVGTEAMIDWMNSILDADTRKLLRANGGSIFEDSLELTATQLWSARFAETFEAQHGYELEPYLPAIAYGIAGNPFAPKPQLFSFAADDAQIVERVRADVEATISALWTQEHALPLTEWANSLGLTFRAQAYGEPIDLGTASEVIDISECETLGCSEGRFRTVSGSAALAGTNLVTSEMLPGGFGNLYGLTPAQIAVGVNREYTFGLNQVIFHGLPYPTIPPSADGTIVDSPAAWPGFHAFSPFIGEAFGPRQATWTMESDIADYYARMQQVLQEGTAKYDIAVLNPSLTGEPAMEGGSLDSAGYTYAYATPGGIANSEVEGSRLEPKGPAFKALVVGTAPIRQEEAANLLRMTHSGLPIVIIGGGPTHATGWAATAADAAAEDAAIVAAIDQIESAPTTISVSTIEEAAPALAAKGITPDASVSDTAVKVVQRSAGSSTFFVLVNRSDAAVSVDATLPRSGDQVPFVLNPWTGDVAGANVAELNSSATTLRGIELAPGAATIIAVAPPTFGKGISVPTVNSTDAMDAYIANGRLNVVADDNGTYTTRLLTGKTVSTTVTNVPVPVELTSWDLELDEWRAGTESSASTAHVQHTLSGVGATPWSSIESLEDAVGVGSYVTTVDASRALAEASAVIEVGDISGSFRVYVNGKPIDVADQLGSRIDIGSALKPGPNEIRIEVASTLLNQLRVHRPAEFGTRTPTVNGITGPVTLDPYVVAASR